MATTTGFYFGHPYYCEDDGFARWMDTGELCEDNPRPCPKCGEMPTEEGHDPCIANLPGVQHACCGHGVETGYFYFDDGRIIRFEGMRLGIIGYTRVQQEKTKKLANEYYNQGMDWDAAWLKARVLVNREG